MSYRQSALSEAIDEIYALRALMADEADILRAHLDYKTFPKSRRRFAEEQLERMRLAASGEYHAAQRHEDYDGKRALRRLGIDDTLTNHQWLKSRGYDPATTHPPTPHGEALRAEEGSCACDCESMDGRFGAHRDECPATRPAHHHPAASTEESTK